MGRLDGKVAIVTGGARGMGRAHARRFVEEGATVVVGDVLDDVGEATAADLGPAARYVHLDVTTEAGWAEAVAAASELGPLGVLVNNAGIVRPASVEDTTLEDFLAVVMVNQVGCFLGMRSVLAPMRANGGGSIVNISSIDGITTSNGLVSYTASKFALRGMTKTAAIEFGHSGIRVNSIHPGIVDTPMVNPDEEPDLRPERFLRLPVPRIGRPVDIANVAVFLASDESAYCTGAEFVVDGGMTCGYFEPLLPGAPLAAIGNAPA